MNTEIKVDGLGEISRAIGTGIAWGGFWIGLGISAGALFNSGLLYSFMG